MGRVDDAVVRCEPHRAAADEVRVAVDHERVLRARAFPDLVQDLLGVRDVPLVVVALRVIEPGDRHAVLVDLVRQQPAWLDR